MGARVLQFHRIKQTAASHRHVQRIAASHQPLAQLGAARFGVGEQIFALDDAQRSQPSRRTKRVAGERGAVRTWGEQRSKLATESNHAAHRETSGNPLGERDHIRRDAARQVFALEGEPCAGTTDARLHLIENQQRTVLVAQLTRLLDELRADRPHAGFALNKLHNHGGDRGLIALSARLERGLQRLGVTRFDELDIRHQRLERFTNGRLIRGGQRAERAPMESVDQRDNTRRTVGRQRTPIQLGELQRRLIAFSPGIAEIHARALGRAGKFKEFGGQLDLRLGSEIVAHMGDFRGLFAHGFHPRGVRIAERVDGDAAEEVEIAVAVHVPNMRAFAVIHHAQRRAEHVHVHTRILPQPLGIFGTKRFQCLICALTCHRNSSSRRPHRPPPWCRCRRT